MIRNVIIHILNEQPLLADVFDLPSAGDAGLVCTNLRTLDGKRPVFIDKVESVFFFPYRGIRFLEIAPAAIERHHAEGGGGVIADALATAAGASAPAPGSTLPVVIDPAQEDDAGLDLGEEIDEDFLKRIRDI